MKIGVISDTHARHFAQLSQNLVRALQKVDLIVHAGDIVTMDVIRGLETLAPVRGVCGNMDYPEIKVAFPDRQVLELEGKKIGLVHGSGGPWEIEKRVLKLFTGVDVIIFGHSHVPMKKNVDGVLLFNPGRAEDSYGILEVGETVSGTLIKEYF